MLIIKKKQNIFIIISKIKIICSILENLKNNINIKAYKEYKLNNNEIINNIIFKYESIIKYILDFTKENKIKYFDIIINLSNLETNEEEIINKNELKNLKYNEKSNIKIFEIQYYPEYLFYKIDIKPYIIFQYNLLSTLLKSNLKLFSTEFLSYYYFYKYSIVKKENLNNYSIKNIKTKIENNGLIINLNNNKFDINLNNSIVILGLYYKLNHN